MALVVSAVWYGLCCLAAIVAVKRCHLFLLFFYTAFYRYTAPHAPVPAILYGLALGTMCDGAQKEVYRCLKILYHGGLVLKEKKAGGENESGGGRGR